MDYLPGGANGIYQGKTLAANTFPNPLSAKAQLGGGNHLNWHPEGYYPGQKDQFITYYNKFGGKVTNNQPVGSYETIPINMLQ